MCRAKPNPEGSGQVEPFVQLAKIELKKMCGGENKNTEVIYLILTYNQEVFDYSKFKHKKRPCQKDGTV